MIFDDYRAQSAAVFRLAALLIASTPIIGYAIVGMRSAAIARLLAWGYAAAAVIGMSQLCRAEPAGFRMFAITGILLYAMKAVVGVEAQAAGERRLPLLRWLAFSIFWPGMQPAAFQKRAAGPLPNAVSLLVRGVSMAAAGVILILAAQALWSHKAPENIPLSLFAATFALLTGISLVLHFGIFNILTGFWRLAGFDCRPLFRAPLLSKSLSEFWGKRWNLAFSQMTALGVYRPLVHKTGQRRAAFAAFLFSGLLHEIAISLPVMSYFGRPMAYFALQGLLVLFERRMEAQGRPISRYPWRGRVWTAFWLLVPITLLFHSGFLRGVIWPLIGLR